MENFEVVITMPEVFDEEIYLDGKDCYLAQALKNKFPESEINVSACGVTKIDGVWFKPLKKTPFDSEIIMNNLGNTLTITFERWRY